MTIERMVLTKDSHPESLERLCIAALSAQEAEAAFMYADRRCRIPPLAKAHHYTLRAEALHRLGDLESAVTSVAAALALAPEDIQANRRMLAWGRDAERISAARALIASDAHAPVLVEALRVLQQEKFRGAGTIRAIDDIVEGWAAWNGNDAAVLTMGSGTSQQVIPLLSQAGHVLKAGGFQNVANFRLTRPRSAQGQTIQLAVADEVISSMRAPPNAVIGIADSVLHTLSEPKEDEGITVIVPIYRDFQATRDCLQSLEAEIRRNSGWRAILVNDDSPERGIRTLTSSFSDHRQFTVLENDTNIGFVGSVNRAIKLTNRADVVLLNADTILPPGSLERLASIARAHPDIGTITPLSNNGEFTSYPVAFECNLLPSPAMIAAIDRLAAAGNNDRLVDIPNGIGFCLYVTRRCLDAVGPLAERFDRGYLEDADFCLRAREQGFRNVCAPSIYVGHHGSRSFGADKRALVVRNLGTLETHFPAYRQECAAFMRADPLRSARQAIERAMLPSVRYERLIFSGAGSVKAVVQARAENLRRAKKAALLATPAHEGSQTVLQIRDPRHHAPQSLAFTLSSDDRYRDLVVYLKSLKFERIEIADPVSFPLDFVDQLFELGKPVDLLVADAGWLCPPGSFIEQDGRVRRSPQPEADCESSVSVGLTEKDAHDGSDWRAYWSAIASKADRILAPNPMAKTFIEAIFPGTAVLLLDATETGNAKKVTGPGKGCKPRIGIAACGETIQEFQSIQTILREFVRRRPDREFVVIGSTFDDLALMANGNVFVSGGLDAADYDVSFQQYRVDRVLLAMPQPLFGHPAEIAARRSGLPVAYFDWSFGRHKPDKPDLALDPRLETQHVVAAVDDWAGAR